MAAIVGPWTGVVLVGEDAEAVLVGGADDGDSEPGVFSYLNLARAFHELDAGADFYCLHRNRLVADEARTGARRRRVRGGARVRVGRRTRPCSGSRPPAYYESALEALDSDPSTAWMVGDDLEADIKGAQQQTGCARCSCAPGSSAPTRSSRAASGPGRDRAHSIAYLPEWLDEHGGMEEVGVDLIEIARIRRALERYPGFPRAVLH